MPKCLTEINVRGHKKIESPIDDIHSYIHLWVLKYSLAIDFSLKNGFEHNRTRVMGWTPNIIMIIAVGGENSAEMYASVDALT